jgi:multidrug efflux pump subunit AcrB
MPWCDQPGGSGDGLPANITGKFAGTAQAYQEALSNQPILIGTALLAVYIVLGILYESLIHPSDHHLDAAVGRRRER